MTEADRIFSRFPPFVQDYIYKRGWDSLRQVQIEAAHTILDTDDNLLLTSSTASGKTEAVFFPILSEFCEDAPKSVGALYIAPLKSLINDQFTRIDEILDMTAIPVFHWHGDVAASHKNKLLQDPGGILQITPESLESLLMRRKNDIPRLFSDLRYVIIDEIHTLCGTDRGNQVICQLCRIASLIGKEPRRIGLSATVGSPELSAKWLSGGSTRACAVPAFEETNLRWRLGMEHFYIQNPETDTEKNQASPIDAGYEYMYDCAVDKKALVFSNSREETEYVTATLRQIAKKRGDPDIFLIHHGNLSASLREEAEAKMKDDSIRAVTCATVTMELGIDIGRLERIIQNDAPNSVSSFLQRLGRSGRRELPPEMISVFREEDPLPNTPLPQLIPWGLLRAIAIVELYLDERFIEPPCTKSLPFSLAFQQTLSICASSGALTAKALAERVLSLPPFEQITKEDYKTLLVSMLQNEMLEMTEEKELIIGLAGEKIINSFKFFAVFKDSEDFTVRCESDEIGTITTPPPVGDRFALAGRVWEVEELDIKRKLIYVKAVDGKMEVSWPGDYGEIHTKILEKMKEVLISDKEYSYLGPNAKKRLEIARRVAKNTSMTEHSLVHLGGYTRCLFPWLGTRSFRTLRKFIAKNAEKYRISNIEFEGCYYITFRMEGGSDRELISGLAREIEEKGIVCPSLVGPTEAPIFEKYDPYIPAELLRRAYAADKLRSDEAEKRIKEILKEY